MTLSRLRAIGRNRTSAALAGVALAFAALAATPAAALDAGMGKRVADGFARPALSGFTEAAHALSADMEALCAAPGAEKLDAAKASFGSTIEAFGRAAVLRFGPFVADHRFERVFFWPDPRGFILKQVQKTLATKDETATDAASLAEKSVAIQGLPALEYLLYGSGAEALLSAENPYRCRYAAAIAGNVATIADETLAGWVNEKPFTASFTEPAADKDPYRSTDEVGVELIKALGMVYEFAIGGELTPALGDAPERANGKRAPLWRSDLTFRLVAAHMHGARDLYLAAGLKDELSADNSWIEDSLSSDVEIADEVLAAIAHPAEQAFTDANDRDQIDTLAALLQDMHDIITQQLAAALGLNAGFNAFDGD